MDDIATIGVFWSILIPHQQRPNNIGEDISSGDLGNNYHVYCCFG
jgi:hypothetical protein